MKPVMKLFMMYSLGVAPHAGAWIETIKQLSDIGEKLVAPHAGAWIETAQWIVESVTLPVAPHAGAWIETEKLQRWSWLQSSRPPRGGVD